MFITLFLNPDSKTFCRDHDSTVFLIINLIHQQVNSTLRNVFLINHKG